MGNTYTQIHIQSVFAVKFRQGLLDKTWRDRLFKYQIGIMSGIGHKVLAVNGIEDHMHIFYSLRPETSISDTMRILKSESSGWINDNHLCERKFEWQSGYGAFSYTKQDIDRIVKYIMNQEAHHAKVPFIDEYKAMLTEFGIEYDERYLLRPPE